jgi:superfamily I DNA/RNA helicase
MPKPTDEQLQALAHFKFERPLKITAFAGAGKTTTLELLARSRRARGAYLAFNKSIAKEASQRFPRTTDCRTTHSIAWQAVKPARRFSSGKMKDRLYPKQLAEVLELKDVRFGPKLRLGAVHQAHLLLRTLRNFSQSADEKISNDHVPRYGRLLGASKEVLADVRAWSVLNSEMIWSRMTNHRDRLPLGHDGYLKLWALGRPALGYQYILLDEAQDTNPVVLGVLADQAGQIVYVGDKHQQIYEWRGAINAMAKIDGCDETYLTQSFRFGALIADIASQVLKTLGEKKSVRGNPAVASTVGANGRTRAVLARTNATVILEILQAIATGLRPFVIGGTKDLKRLLSDVFELKKGNPGECPEFFGFENWTEVVEFSETEEGEDLRTFVQLVEQHGERKLWAAVSSVQEKEENSDIVLSTAHKAKGLEWESVRLAPDFLSSRLNGTDPNAEAEVRLFYVAMTRAKNHLSVDPEMLATFASGEWRKRKPEVPLPAPYVSRPQSSPMRDNRTQPPPLPRAVPSQVTISGSVNGRTATQTSPPLLRTQPSPPKQRRLWWQFWK